MKVLMPSHARRVQQHKGESLFLASGIEEQLEKLHAGTVVLPSGGYLVIDSTEALVAVDVNSGRSTRERNIEETAVKTNLEAADEIARQLRLRDLAGLIVIDFIDMDDRRNSAQVERRLKEALKVDRAKVQVERIGKLGLLAMSRQRLRPSIFEASMERCPNCDGSGFVRSVESAALHAVRAIEQEALSGRHASLAAHLQTDMAFYLLNEKREVWKRLEEVNGVAVRIGRDDTLVPGSWRLEGLEPREPAAPAAVSEGRRPPKRPAWRTRSRAAGAAVAGAGVTAGAARNRRPPPKSSRPFRTARPRPLPNPSRRPRTSRRPPPLKRPERSPRPQTERWGLGREWAGDPGRGGGGCGGRQAEDAASASARLVRGPIRVRCGRWGRPCR